MTAKPCGTHLRIEGGDDAVMRLVERLVLLPDRALDRVQLVAVSDPRPTGAGARRTVDLFIGDATMRA
ncbi:hypothetical protein [Actinomadura sediminis]|uniref:Uncharacterized protein n=1 Tax=Actinomadura sediminis TaxID=1038904 RepID=A0ABW3ES85_9ACTN